jgi:hypothetical protein
MFIGLGGKLRSGKDAVADHLVDRHDFVKMGMSDPLLEHALILNPYVPINTRPNGLVGEEGLFVHLSDLVAQVGYVEAKKNPEVRRFMQADGTDGGREFHHEDVWVDRMVKTAKAHLDAGKSIVVTGLRFPNELQAVQQLGGHTFWVDRPSEVDSAAPAAAHASENSVDASMFDRTILNDGTLEDLYATVDNLVKDYQL